MSQASIASKRSLSHIYPINRKRFIVVVNPKVPQWMGSVDYLIARGAKVIVLPTFGSTVGVPLQLTPHVRDVLLKAWTAEEGRGLTALYYSLDEAKKLAIIQSIKDVTVPVGAAATKGTGKTPFFSRLPLDVKVKALQEFGVLLDLPDKATSAPLVDALSALPNVGRVTFVSDPLCAADTVSAMSPRDIVLLENLRYYLAETVSRLEEQRAYATVLAGYGDVFVNDAFVESHLALCSTTQIPKILRHGACGLSMDRELHALAHLLSRPSPPLGVVVGGANIRRGVDVVVSLTATAQVIAVGGLVSLPFLAARGIRVSIALPIDLVQAAAAALDVAAEKEVVVVLPVDHIVTVPTAKWLHLTQTSSIPADATPLDVGPATVQAMAKALRNCRSIIWVGALGNLNESSTGTVGLSQDLQSMNAIKIAGGTGLVNTIQQQPALAAAFSHLSAGSVAILALLRDKSLAGAEPLSEICEMNRNEASRATVHQLLRGIGIISGCGSEQLQRIALKAVRRVHERGDVLLTQGTRYTGLWVVASGAVVIEETATVNGPGSVLGQMECFSLAPSEVTVRVSEPSTVLYFVSRTALVEIILENPDIGLQVISTLCTTTTRHTVEVMPSPLQRTVSTPALAFSPSASVDSITRAVWVAMMTEALLLPLTTILEPYVPQSRTCLIARTALGRAGLRIAVSAAAAALYGLLMSAWHPTTAEAKALGPVAAAALTAVVTSPFRRLASGAPLTLSSSQAASQAALDALLSLAPLLAQLTEHQWAGRRQTRGHPPTSPVLGRMVFRFIVGLQLWVFAKHVTGMRGSSLMYALRGALQVMAEALARR